jgi:hypothetical protein
MTTPSTPEQALVDALDGSYTLRKEVRDIIAGHGAGYTHDIDARTEECFVAFRGWLGRRTAIASQPPTLDAATVEACARLAYDPTIAARIRALAAPAHNYNECGREDCDLCAACDNTCSGAPIGEARPACGLKCAPDDCNAACVKAQGHDGDHSCLNVDRPRPPDTGVRPAAGNIRGPSADAEKSTDVLITLAPPGGGETGGISAGARPGLRPARLVAEACAALWGRHAAPELHEQLVDALTLVIEADRLSRPTNGSLQGEPKDGAGRDGCLSSGRPAKEGT